MHPPAPQGRIFFSTRAKAVLFRDSIDAFVRLSYRLPEGSYTYTTMPFDIVGLDSSDVLLRGVGAKIHRFQKRKRPRSSATAHTKTASDRLSDAFIGMNSAPGLATRATVLSLIGQKHLGAAVCAFGLEPAAAPKSGIVLPCSRIMTQLMASIYAKIPKPDRARNPADAERLDPLNDELAASIVTDPAGAFSAMPQLIRVFEKVHHRSISEDDIATARVAAAEEVAAFKLKSTPSPSE